MTEIAQKSQVKEIERIVEHLMEDWMGHEFSSMDRYFANHVVMIETATHQRILGIDDILEQYELYIEDSEIKDYKITELMVDLVEDTAVAYFTYQIKYEMDNTTFNETNTEILVFHKHNNKWQIVWRTQILGEA